MRDVHGVSHKGAAGDSAAFSPMPAVPGQLMENRGREGTARGWEVAIEGREGKRASTAVTPKVEGTRYREQGLVHPVGTQVDKGQKELQLRS